MTLDRLKEELEYETKLLEVLKRHMQTNMGFLDYMAALEQKDRCEQKIRLYESQIEQLVMESEL